MANLSHALKEWAIAVDALEKGRTIVLLRKGGIREQGRFTIAQNQVLLYPTYEHQQPHLLKDDYQSQVQPVSSGWHPDQVQIGSVADITHIFQVSEAAVLDALLPFHIWNSQFAAERFQWKPKLPLYVLLLRVSKLPPQIIAYQAGYGGCRSWIDLEVAIDLDNATPVLSDQVYSDQVEKIQKIVSNSTLG
ncbi:MAG: DUF1802 family protein, partial [Phormidesmis sp. CAN_BIN44]|nr:DUF1802 family protein [Phormidesmis sp. CAN_BIN44]